MLRELSAVEESRGCFLAVEQGSGAGTVVGARELSCSTACGISQTRHRTDVPCITRWVLNRTTREALDHIFLDKCF